MFFKEDLEKILKEKKENEILSIFYENDKSILIRDLNDWCTVVKKSNDKTLGIEDLILEDNYIKVDYVVLEKEQEKYNLKEKYSIILPYKSIKLIKINELVF